MGTPAEHAAILSYVRTLRTLARQDKHLAARAYLPGWREHHLAERRRRINEAWHRRCQERDLRGRDSIETILARGPSAPRWKDAA